MHSGNPPRARSPHAARRGAGRSSAPDRRLPPSAATAARSLIEKSIRPRMNSVEATMLQERRRKAGGGPVRCEAFRPVGQARRRMLIAHRRTRSLPPLVWGFNAGAAPGNGRDARRGLAARTARFAAPRCPAARAHPTRSGTSAEAATPCFRCRTLAAACLVVHCGTIAPPVRRYSLPGPQLLSPPGESATTGSCPRGVRFSVLVALRRFW